MNTVTAAPNARREPRATRLARAVAAATSCVSESTSSSLATGRADSKRLLDAIASLSPDSHCNSLPRVVRRHRNRRFRRMNTGRDPKTLRTIDEWRARNRCYPRLGSGNSAPGDRSGMRIRSIDHSETRMTPIEPHPRQLGLSDYLAILDRRKWVIIQSTLIVAVVAFILSAQQDKVFAARRRGACSPGRTCRRSSPASRAPTSTSRPGAVRRDAGRPRPRRPPSRSARSRRPSSRPHGGRSSSRAPR